MQNQQSDNRIKDASYLKPSSLVFGTLVAFNLLPGLWIWAFSWKEDLYFRYSLYLYDEGVRTYLKATILFLSIFALICFLTRGKLFQSKVNAPATEDSLAFEARSPMYLAITIMGIIFTLVYFFDGGYEKLLAFGSIMDEWAFRLIGYDDRSRIVIAMLEASRRVLLPIGVSYLFVLFRLGRIGAKTFLLGLGAACQLLGAAMTLDRAPILLFFVMFLFINLCIGLSYMKVLRTLLGAIAVLLPIAGLTTFLQYNISAFSGSDIVTTGQDFLLHRTILVPSIASIELSFIQFPIGSDKLLLRFSRLTALFGGTYVGTEDANSIYVTPVGAIADIWRNFGYPGIVVCSAGLALYFRKLDSLMRNVGPVDAIVHSFNALSLAFYYIFGGLFSQGVIFQMLMGYALLTYSNARWKTAGFSRPADIGGRALAA